MPADVQQAHGEAEERAEPRAARVAHVEGRRRAAVHVDVGGRQRRRVRRQRHRQRAPGRRVRHLDGAGRVGRGIAHCRVELRHCWELRDRHVAIAFAGGAGWAVVLQQHEGAVVGEAVFRELRRGDLGWPQRFDGI